MSLNRCKYNMLSAINKKFSHREGYACLTFVEKVLKEIGVVENNRAIASIQELEELRKEYYIEDRTIFAKDKGSYIWRKGNNHVFTFTF